MQLSLHSLTTVSLMGVAILPVLIGGAITLIGVLAAQFMTLTLEKRRAQREDERRWHQTRLDLYFAIFAAFDRYGSAVRDLDDGTDVDVEITPRDELDGL